MLCWQSSLADLNTRMPEPLPMNRFRPNLVVDDSVEPWAEDDWQALSVVGPPDRKVEFLSLKPCSRCKARPSRAPSAQELSVLPSGKGLAYSDVLCDGCSSHC